MGTVLLFGAVWGLSEALLGMWLRSCASSVSGSLMTGVALFFMASTWALTQSRVGLIGLVVLAGLLKMFDALLLSLPLRHGAVANPIFAFVTEGAAFLILITLGKNALAQKKSGQALRGGLAALGAVALFPLVKFVTGIPACVVPGKTIPLSLYYAPLAVGLSLITVPLGFWLGARVAAWEGIWQRGKMQLIVSAASLIVCLAIMASVRLI